MYFVPAETGAPPVAVAPSDSLPNEAVDEPVTQSAEALSPCESTRPVVDAEAPASADFLERQASRYCTDLEQVAVS